MFRFFFGQLINEITNSFCVNSVLKPVYPFMYVKLVALFSNTTFLCVTIIMFLSRFSCNSQFFWNDYVYADDCKYRCVQKDMKFPR